MRHGVPVVGAGKTEGKNDIDARIGYNRLGVDLRSERPRPARIRAAVRRVLADPRFAANVAELRAELESYDPMARIEAALHDEMLTAQP
jgi:UDP:flavonoid glycosyltransferase YjiC (YdhE family)